MEVSDRIDQEMVIMNDTSPPTMDVNMEEQSTQLCRGQHSLEDNNEIVQPISFKDAVQGSSQWFDEAKRIHSTSLGWEDCDIDPPDESREVKFLKPTLEKLRQPWKMTLMVGQMFRHLWEAILHDPTYSDHVKPKGILKLLIWVRMSTFLDFP